MIKRITSLSVFAIGLLSSLSSQGQITLQKDYQSLKSPAIGTFQGINFREGGFSTLFPIPGTKGKEFWTCSDRGVNIDDANANPAGCRPTYDKMFVFPSYAPKIHRVRIQGDSIQIIRTITMKRPDGTNATGVLNPTGFGSTSAEVASTDTVNDCSRFASKTTAKDIWSIDPEGLVVDKEGNFWISEENGPTIWKLNPNGVVVKRFTPYAGQPGSQPQDSQIDTVFKYRKNNRGFESLSITPNGKIYSLIQSPLLYPNKATGEATQVHRLIEIDPATNAMRVLVYLNDGVIGTSGANQIRLSDWKTGDMAAINDSTFLVIEAALRGTTDIKKVYKININGATAVTGALYGGLTVEGLVDAAGLAAQGITPVKKTLFLDALANGWPSSLEKIEGIAIVNDSTVVICNDNDFGQVSPAANGIATATGYTSHMFQFGFQGANKMTDVKALGTTYAMGVTGTSSSQAPYLQPTIAGANYTSILTVGDAANNYKMVGIPDGLGSFDNGNGTFTLLMNHELGNTSGVVRAHGSMGAFVSKWIINKSDLRVISGSDLIRTIKLWNPITSSYTTYNGNFPTSAAALTRFCSGDLPAATAYFNPLTGKGTTSRIYMNGEESGNEGRGFAHLVNGPEGGTSYELPYLGKYSWENAVANPHMSDVTIVAGLDDATPGQVYFYVGTKKTTGNEIEKAGLTGGKLYSMSVTNMLTETSATVPTANTTFDMIDLGQVQNMTGTTLNTNSNNMGVTTFLRPEDGAWDPSSPNDFYFNTTNAFNAPSRLWHVHFDNLDSLQNGGNITAVLDGTEGQQMLDNMTIDNSGHILLVEDVGGNAHIGKIWQYTIATDQLVQIARHDSTRFLNGSANFLTQDEEATGIVDAQAVLGPGMFLVNVQAHYGIPGELVEGGQLLAFNNPATAAANPEIDVQGNSITIVNTDNTPDVTDNTDFGGIDRGTTATKTFTIKNTGGGDLKINTIRLLGNTTGLFNLTGLPTFPLTVAANGTFSFTLQFAPVTANRIIKANVSIESNDLDENHYVYSVQGTGVIPEIDIRGNNISITNGDQTAGPVNNTDYGNVNRGATETKQFVIRNTGQGTLKVTGVTFTGTNAAQFTVVNGPSFPLTLASLAQQSIDVQFAPVVAGDHTAQIVVANNDDNEASYTFALIGTGIDPTSVSSVVGGAAGIKLYPNPTGNEATVSINLKKSEKVNITVYDVQGRKVMAAIDQTLNSGEQAIKLNTSSLQNGIYFVQIAGEATKAKIRMVIIH
ncbi:MAG: choice-of-anchor D domain-containing protein [Sphingobacteriales bacterium]|nr:MAG: choice-of-anchor D domain-containing protein [Sphingobacteriales bacterium]